ncbi:hypothetical protein EJ08DRAFT_596878 [Tothia fuscella]|uniref:Uncharacterized protein n=1 Tax=Tothia fuscella TaxID=1048955 RepID=A0A9P4NIF8_9PEZI|nr:hypothetical protein EJ08DRAFT_596878 [Tothia fuscella]
MAFERSPSPSLTLSPTLALDACPLLDRSVSTASSTSNSSDSRSRRSSSSRISDSGKRRGYMRPQATTYAESAKNRDSVMSLGTIAHLQYYFARTGLLDGKGAQFAKENARKRKPSTSSGVSGLRSSSLGLFATPTSAFLTASPGNEYAISDSGITDSPTDDGEGGANWEGEMMLPPTVSTYNQRPIYVQPPPDVKMLRRELTEALEDALKVLKESDKSPDLVESQGWYEIQGMHLLDITTLAIRAAKNYYTAHAQPQRLYSIKSERQIRSELYQVLEILKRMAARNFADGIRQSEKVAILTWIVGISELIQSEINQEKAEEEERGRWNWKDGDWNGREREREWAFLRSFTEVPDALPEWTDPRNDESLPTPFLLYFQSGLRLVHLHNTLVQKSKRQFEEIKVFHIDTGKPYRMAENLRFWIKAAQLRWDTHLDVDVMGVVHGKSPEAWRQFDVAILKWCKGIREEISAEWLERNSPSRRVLPTLRIEKSPTRKTVVPQLEIDTQEGAKVGMGLLA